MNHLQQLSALTAHHQKTLTDTKNQFKPQAKQLIQPTVKELLTKNAGLKTLHYSMTQELEQHKEVTEEMLERLN